MDICGKQIQIDLSKDDFAGDHEEANKFYKNVQVTEVLVAQSPLFLVGRDAKTVCKFCSNFRFVGERQSIKQL